MKTWRLLIEARWARQRAGACCSGGITALAGGPADAEAVFSSGPAAAVDITAGTCCGGGAAAAAGAGFAGAAAGNGSAGSLRGKGSSHGSSGELYGAGPHAGGQQPQGVAGRLQRWQRRALGGRPLMTRQQVRCFQSSVVGHPWAAAFKNWRCGMQGGPRVCRQHPTQGM